MRPLLKGIHELSTDSGTTEGFEHEQFIDPGRDAARVERGVAVPGHVADQSASCSATNRQDDGSGNFASSALENCSEFGGVGVGKARTSSNKSILPMRLRVESSPWTRECALACAPRQGPDWISPDIR